MHVVISKDRSFPAAKRVKSHRNRDRYIYPNHSHFDLFDERPGCCAVMRINGGAISVLVFIDELKSRSRIVNAHHTENRAKNFLSINPHWRPYIVEQAATEEKSLLGARQSQLTPVDDQSSPFLDSKIDIRRDPIKMRFCDERTHFHSFQIARPNFERFDPRN